MDKNLKKFKKDLNKVIEEGVYGMNKEFQEKIQLVIDSDCTNFSHLDGYSLENIQIALKNIYDKTGMKFTVTDNGDIIKFD